MKISWFLTSGVALALLIGSPPALADGWSLHKLVPFGKRETRKPARKGPARPSPLEKLGADMKKLNAQTKRFFAGAKDALTWKKPAPKRRPTNQYVPWIREPKQQRHVQYKKKQKKSWLDVLFRRKEPKPVESLKEWVGLPRLGP